MKIRLLSAVLAAGVILPFTSIQAAQSTDIEAALFNASQQQSQVSAQSEWMLLANNGRKHYKKHRSYRHRDHDDGRNTLKYVAPFLLHGVFRDSQRDSRRDYRRSNRCEVMTRNHLRNRIGHLNKRGTLCCVYDRRGDRTMCFSRFR